MYETYRRGFVYGDLGVSSAMLSLLLLLVFAVIGVQFSLLRRRS